MSDQNMTRRTAVKLGGSALATVGLAASGSPATTTTAAPASGADGPDFRGKVVIFYAGGARNAHTLTDPVFEVRGGRLFVTGRSPTTGDWSDGLAGAVAWDAVTAYLAYDSVEAYEASRKRHQSKKEAKG